MCPDFRCGCVVRAQETVEVAILVPDDKAYEIEEACPEGSVRYSGPVVDCEQGRDDELCGMKKRVR